MLVLRAYFCPGRGRFRAPEGGAEPPPSKLRGALQVIRRASVVVASAMSAPFRRASAVGGPAAPGGHRRASAPLTALPPHARRASASAAPVSGDGGFTGVNPDSVDFDIVSSRRGSAAVPSSRRASAAAVSSSRRASAAAAPSSRRASAALGAPAPALAHPNADTPSRVRLAVASLQAHGLHDHAAFRGPPAAPAAPAAPATKVTFSRVQSSSIDAVDTDTEF